MKKSLFTIMAVVALLSAACGNSKTQSTADDNTDSIKVLTIDALMNQSDSLAGKDVVVEGVCTHTCKHGAKKIFLMGSTDSVTIRVEAGELGSFDPKCVNSKVKVWGKLTEQRIDESYLKDWEAKLAAKTDAKHGEGNGKAGCDSEKKARKEKGDTPQKRIADFRTKIADEKAKSGKEYLSFYYLVATKYEIAQ